MLQKDTEKEAVFSQFKLSGRMKTDETMTKFNEAFLEAGRAVELVFSELKSATDNVASSFQTLPEIQQSSLKMSEAAQASKSKVDELTGMGDS
ncbi:MAG: hypothetical protein COB89_01880 [Piscirickettsiaceae bacterium]|nr:MAG: hypothetical protein COB89_06890 [Piscirickettsiaceae bacterium]PCH85595.1 MAG: hypothetical protein COB89_01880 [Piscirickettsiaceae bacterium]